MLWRGDASGKCIYLNRAQREFWGVAEDGLDSFRWDNTLLPEDAGLVFGPFSEGMSKQQAFECEARYRRADGDVRILRTRAEPRFDVGGTFTGMVGVNVDVTDERRAQAELAESEARLRALADNLPFGMVYQIVRSGDGVRRFTFVSSRCRALNGLDAEDARRDPAALYNLIEPEFRDAFTRAEEVASAKLQGFDFETKMRRADGEVRWRRISSAPRPQANGDVVWDGVQVDIHDVKVAEERRQLLMTEMSHRIKNNLSTVLSIAAQTGRSASSYDAFNKSFQARIHALSKSHDLLMQDARDAAGLREILETELGPYSADTSAGRTLLLEGEPVLLSARAAVGMALVVHELATNAAKYGAYSCGGSVEVHWSVAEPLISLYWRERGGPPVVQPNKEGFGTRLIESVVCGELAGAVKSRFSPQGFQADISFRNIA
jgi:PAS domain S-box-containing protein